MSASKEPNMSIRYNIAKEPGFIPAQRGRGNPDGLSMPAVYHDDAGIRMMLNKRGAFKRGVGLESVRLCGDEPFRKNETVYGYGRCEYGRYH